METAVLPENETRACPECAQGNPVIARYCGACGGRLLPPPACPACGAATIASAKFCADCGVRVVGSRIVGSPSEPVARQVDAPREGQVDTSTQLAPTDAEAAAALAGLAATRDRARGAGLGTNVLFFLAVLLAFVVAMYAWNKDRPAEPSMFGGAPPPPAAEAPPPAASGAKITGQARVAPEIAERVPSGATLYLVVRNAGMPDSGPPLAVRRYDAASLPLEFEVGAGHVMMPGMGFDGPFDVYARLDKDGNVMTRDPGDLVSSSPARDVAAGAGAIDVVLDRVVGD